MERFNTRFVHFVSTFIERKEVIKRSYHSLSHIKVVYLDRLDEQFVVSDSQNGKTTTIQGSGQCVFGKKIRKRSTPGIKFGNA